MSTYVDYRGNSFHPTPPQLKLLKSGWQMMGKERRGGFTTIKWRHPETSEVWPQSTAVEIEKLRAKTKREMTEMIQVGDKVRHKKTGVDPHSAKRSED